MPPAKFTENKIGAIGTINRDTIYQPGGGQVESWGGLLYNLKYLCEGGVGTIIPAVNIGRDSFKPIIKILGQFNNIDLSQIQKVPEKNNHCFLHYHNQSHKCEILKGGVPSLTYFRIKPLLDCDLVLVNFISGPDVRLSALEKFRENYDGIIYMDIHSLTLGRRKVPGGYRRHLRRPRYWQRYAACADILQINEGEFELLSGQEFTLETGIDFVGDNLNSLRCLTVTRGASGCSLIFREDGFLLGRNVPARKVGKVYDTTGCGDVFGAGFIREYLKSKDFIKAARSGNRLAAERCGRKRKMF